VPERGIDAVVEALYVDSEDLVEISFRSVFGVANMRDAGVIYQDMDTIATVDFGERGHYFGLTAYITGVGCGGPAGARNFRRDCLRIFGADIKNVDRSSIGCEFVSDGAANSATATSDNRSLTVQEKLASCSIACGQSETPRFQGMKSS
jgi:hypothetical protein